MFHCNQCYQIHMYMPIVFGFALADINTLRVITIYLINLSHGSKDTKTAFCQIYAMIVRLYELMIYYFSS